MDHLRRRDFFVRGAAAVGAASVLRPGALGAGEPLERPVRVGVAGVGNRGRHLVGVLLGIPGVEVRALCDVSEENARKAAGIVTAAGRPFVTLDDPQRQAARELGLPL